MITGIIVALREELSTLYKIPAFTGERKFIKGSLNFVADNLAIVYSGAGIKNAEGAAERLIANGATKLISWGCAGALSESLKAGDLVISDDLVDEGNIKITVKSGWLGHASKRLHGIVNVVNGSVFGSDKIVSSCIEKSQLQVKSKAIAVDMESVAIAKVAGRKNIPFLAIRAIADPVTMSLPVSIKYAMSDDGEINLLKLIVNVLKNPQQIPELLRLGCYFSAAKKTLQRVAANLDSIIDFKSSNPARQA